MKKEYIFGFLGLLIGFLIGVFVASNFDENNRIGMMDFRFDEDSKIQSVSSNTLDAHFIEQMIPHHEDAITMSNLALKKAKRSEVKVLAQNIIDSQSKEIMQMKEWYKDWFGKDVPEDQQVMKGHGMMGSGNMHMGMMGSDMDISRLENAQDFDKEFVEQMIPHHQMAVMMAQMLKNGTQRSEMKQLAGDIIVAQTNEINTMRSWLAEWNQ